jgi:two-component system, chemotaxis family, sensor kinase CheA
MSADPYKYFRVEAREILEQIGRGMLDLERDSPTPELIQRVLRCAHTLKGAARVVRQKEIADHAHAIEDALAALRDSPPAKDRVDAVLKLLDAIGARVAALGQPQGSTSKESVPPAEESFRNLRVDVEEMDGLIHGVAEIHVQLSALRRGLDSFERLRHLKDILGGQLRSIRVPANGAVSSASALVEEVGELLSSVEGDLSARVERVDREVRQVRDASARLRLVSVGLMFGVLERTARDTARSVGKRVAFATRGGEIRLDAHVLSAMQNALVQIVRNGVAHGIETEWERSAAGKSPEGRVTLEVSRRANRVTFVCTDDGRGVDVEAVRRAAQRKGSLSQDTQRLGPEELLRMLLQGGISTSRTITEVSGRGIGLDVVREAASRLGGDVHVRTEAGTGTSFEIVVPVSLASLDALRVEADLQTAIIPLDAIRRTLRIRPEDIARTAAGESIVVDGSSIPFAPLARSLRIAPQRNASSPRAWSAVVVESGGAMAALGVDRLCGTENVVLRPLPRLCPVEAVIAGASLDADGNPQLVLDPAALVANAHRSAPAPTIAPGPRLPILIIDDSLTTRMLEQSILESAGYSVDVAMSGEEALRKARATRYLLFLVDVEMPGIDGFEFIARVRGDPELRGIPAILVTSRNAPEDRRRGEEVGAQGYVVKGEFDQTLLLERIRELVRE